MSRTERVFYSRTFVCVKGMQMESQIIMGIEPRSGKYGLGHHTLRRDARRTRRVRLHHHDKEPRPAHSPRHHPRQPPRNHRPLPSHGALGRGHLLRQQREVGHPHGAGTWRSARRLRIQGTRIRRVHAHANQAGARGHGAADKRQIQYMVRTVLKLDHEPRPDHAADALAAAITHARLRTSRIIEQQVG